MWVPSGLHAASICAPAPAGIEATVLSVAGSITWGSSTFWVGHAVTGPALSLPTIR
jgi:hypothetical protein